MAEARATGQEGKWLFTLHNASRLPFLQYSANRPLREQMYKAYINRGNNNDKNDNKKIITDIVRLRLERRNCWVSTVTPTLYWTIQWQRIPPP